MKNVVTKTKEVEEKQFYTTQELVAEEWFPVRSIHTVKKLIESGKLEAVDVSTNEKYKRYRISRVSAVDFVERQKSNPVKTAKRKK